MNNKKTVARKVAKIAKDLPDAARPRILHALCNSGHWLTDDGTGQEMPQLVIGSTPDGVETTLGVAETGFGLGSLFYLTFCLKKSYNK
jgi:hypothetical protein